MNTQLFLSRRRIASATLVAIALTAGGIAFAFADTIVPDPPVPAEGPIVMASADVGDDGDCRCAAPQAHELESQVDRHVAQWQALQTVREAKVRRPLQPKNIVEGVVGFPVRHYRLAADDQAAGSAQ